MPEFDPDAAAQIVGASSYELLLLDDQLLSHQDITRDYGWSRPTTYRLTAAGEIEAVKIGRRTFWKRRSIRNYIARQPAPVLRASGA